MAYPVGEPKWNPPRVDFDRRLKLEFHGSKITSDAGLLACRELDDALGLTGMTRSILTEARRGKNIRHLVEGLFRQSVFARLAGYVDVNDAERLSLDPAMRPIVDLRGLDRNASSSSEMGRFETEWLTSAGNLAALADLPGAWIDRVHACRSPKLILLDMDSSESPTYGNQEGPAYERHFGSTCFHPLFVFNQFGDMLKPVVARYRDRAPRRFYPSFSYQARDLGQAPQDPGAAQRGRTLVHDHAARS